MRSEARPDRPMAVEPWRDDCRRLTEVARQVPLQQLAQISKIMMADDKSTRTRRWEMTQMLAGTAATLTPYGELTQRLDMDGRPGPEYINPFALLFQLCTVSVDFATILKSCCKGGRARAIFYADETRPGNALRPDKGRSLQCLYWTLAEFPHWFRSRRCGWFVFATVLSKDVIAMPGGVSGLLRKMMHVFWSTSGWNFHTVGIRLPGEFLLRGSFMCMLGDEKAIKEMWGLKGASGTKPCCWCKNVVGRMHVDRMDPYFVHHTWGTRFDMHTPESWTDILTTLEHHVAYSNKGHVDNLCQVFGIGYNAETVSFDPHLRKFANPKTGTYWDWMHCIVGSGGVLQYEANALVYNLKQEGISPADLDGFASHVKWPRFVTGLTRDFFQGRFVDRADAHVHAFASEMFLVSDVLACFIVKVLKPGNLLPEHCQCFKLIRDVIDILRLGDEAVQHVEPLRRIIAAHHSAFMRLYPECAKPKLHYLFHIPDCLANTGVNVACFAPERKHREVKRIANHTFAWIGSHVLRRMLHETLADILQEHAVHEVHLQGPVRELPQLSSTLGVDMILGAKAAVLARGEVRVRDLLLFNMGDKDAVGFACYFVWCKRRCSTEMHFVHVEMLQQAEPKVWSLRDPRPMLVDLQLVRVAVPYFIVGECVEPILPD